MQWKNPDGSLTGGVVIEDGAGNKLGTAANPLNLSGGSGSNASVGATGAAVPSSATALGFQNAAGNLSLPTPAAGLPVADSGTAITGAAIPAGGVGLTGWLSAIWAKVSGAALDATSQSILTALQAQRAETIWTDDSNAFYVRIDNGGSISWLTPSGGASSAPGAGARPAAGASLVIDATRYQATAAAAGYAINDYLSHVVTADPSTGVVIANFWLNVTQNAKLSSPPPSSDITPIAPLGANASTAANQTTANTTLANIYSRLLSIGVAAGSAIIGKVGVDQTTPGTTNGVAINGVGAAALALGQATKAGGVPVTLPSDVTASVANTPTITASAYAAGYVVGGVQHFSNVFGAAQSGVVESLFVVAAATVQANPLALYLFTANPAAGTYADHGAPTWGAADKAGLVGVYTLSSPASGLGTMTVWNLDGVGKAIKGATDLWIVAVAPSGLSAPASSADLAFTVTTLKD